MLKLAIVVSALLGLVALAAAGPPLRNQREPLALFNKNQWGIESSSQIFADDEHRLPLNFVPLTYDIYTVPIIGDATVDPAFPAWSAPGSVTIQIRCDIATSRITLHSAETVINQGDLTVTDDATNQTLTVTLSFNGTYQFLHIDVAQNLTVGSTYTIAAKFVAGVRDVSTVDPKVGLYRAYYTDPSTNVTKGLATTQFETIGFRYFCPGFDEPKFKAKFTLHIAHPNDMNSYSNTERLSANQTGTANMPATPVNYVWDHYNQTVLSSSYLMALVVSDFQHTLAADGLYRLPVGIIGPPYLMGLGGGSYAADESARILKTFEDIFGAELPYPMGKMDSAAIPRNYFTFGAMENWGLNTYRDNLLLYYPGISLEANRYQIASILSHELAHQWFGNRVTTHWWSHIWLNEGFATYFSYKGTRHLAHYDTERQIVADAVHTALEADAGTQSRTIVNEGGQQEVADMSIFGTMPYQKGASLINMMAGFLGEATLMTGLKNYLLNKTFDAAHQDDLFAQLQAVADPANLPTGVTVKTIMDTWTLKRGFPLVRVQRGGLDTIYLSQERFRNNANSNTEVDPDELWYVPISIATAAAPNFVDQRPKVWIRSDASLVPYKHASINTAQWLVVNPDVHGYYRVLYDTQLARLILDQLESNHTVISGLNRGQFIDDYFTFAQQGLASYESALAFTRYLAKETDHAALLPALNQLAKLIPHFTGSNTALFQDFKNYLSPRIEGALTSIGWDQPDPNEHGINVTLRALLLDWACTLEHPVCRNGAINYFNDWKANPSVNPIPLNLQNVLYCAIVAYGGEEAFDFVLQKYQASLSKNQEIDSETTRLVSGLTCSQNDLSLLRLLVGTVNGTLIRSSHLRLVLEGVGTNSYGRKHVYGVLRDDWKEIAGLVGDVTNPQIIADIVLALTTYQNTADQVPLISAIQTKIIYDDVIAYSAIHAKMTQAIERIRANAGWSQVNGLPIAKWFRDEMTTVKSL